MRVVRRHSLGCPSPIRGLPIHRWPDGRHMCQTRRMINLVTAQKLLVPKQKKLVVYGYLAPAVAP